LRRFAPSSPASSPTTPRRWTRSPETGSSTCETASSRYHPPRRDRLDRHPAHPAVDPARPRGRHGRARDPRAHPERPLPPPDHHRAREGAPVQALAPEGVERRARAVEPGARARDEEARAARQAHARSATGAEGDVEAHTRGTARAPRDAGAAGRLARRRNEPPDAAAPREAAPRRAAPRPLVLDRVPHPDVRLDV